MNDPEFRHLLIKHLSMISLSLSGLCIPITVIALKYLLTK